MLERSPGCHPSNIDVHAEDFSAMTSFIERAATTFKETVPDCKVTAWLGC
jgi:hypothetical protein